MASSQLLIKMEQEAMQKEKEKEATAERLGKRPDPEPTAEGSPTKKSRGAIETAEPHAESVPSNVNEAHV